MQETVVTIAPTSSLPEIIRAIRGELSQEEFAQAIGVTHSAVSQWENGKIGLSLASTIALLEHAKATEKRNLAVLLLQAVGGLEAWL